MHTCVRRALLVGAALVLAPVTVVGQFDSTDQAGSQSRFGISPPMQSFDLSAQGSESETDNNESGAGSALTASDAVRIRRALSDPRYPATPGDVYRPGTYALVVPLRQFRVTVLRSVESPGPYPRIPDREVRHDVDLAGGVSEDLNAFGRVRIRNRDDQEVDTDASVGPECTIVARCDSPRYWFLRTLDVAPTTMSFANPRLNLLETFGLAIPGSMFVSERAL